MSMLALVYDKTPVWSRQLGLCLVRSRNVTVEPQLLLPGSALF